MMGRLIGALLFCFFAVGAQAQFFKGFLRQKGENRKLLAEQIIALNVYSGYIKKGFNVARDGLRLVNDVKDGEFSLHRDYFKSLKSVSPAIRSYARVGEIIVLQEKTIRRCGEFVRSVRKSGSFQPSELTFLTNVFDRVLDDCLALVGTLEDLTAGKYEMTDAERMRRIDGLYQDALSQHEFVQVFGQEAMALGRQQAAEALEAEKVAGWYGSEYR